MTDTTKQIEAIAKDASERVAKNAGVAPELCYGPIYFALEDAARATPVSPAQAAKQLTDDAEALVNIAGHLREVKHWAAQASVRELAEMAQRLLAAAQTAPAKPQSDLHSAIINIPHKRADNEFMNAEHRMLYKNGHRDARHAAAELVAADEEHWKIRALTAEANLRDCRVDAHDAQLRAASVGAQVAGDRGVGFPLYFTREQWGIIFDGVMLEIERSEKRKQANSESNSDVRANEGRAILAAIKAESTAPVPVPATVTRALREVHKQQADPKLATSGATAYERFLFAELARLQSAVLADASIPAPATVPSKVVKALKQIEHSMLQARNPMNDRLRELNLTLNIVQPLIRELEECAAPATVDGGSVIEKIEDAAPAKPQSDLHSAGTIDTPELAQLLRDYTSALANKSTHGFTAAYEALITHINAWNSASVAAARKDALAIVPKMREMLAVQGASGNWNCDSYMHGMYNGMEYMLAMIEGEREPAFREAPAKWLSEPKIDATALAAAREQALEITAQAAEDWLAKLDRHSPESAYGGPVLKLDPQGEWLDYDEVKAALSKIFTKVAPSTPPSAPAGVEGLNWSDYERIADIPAVHNALQGFSEDPTGDNGTCVVRAILTAVRETSNNQNQG